MFHSFSGSSMRMHGLPLCILLKKNKEVKSTAKVGLKLKSINSAKINNLLTQDNVKFKIKIIFKNFFFYVYYILWYVFLIAGTDSAYVDCMPLVGTYISSIIRCLGSPLGVKAQFQMALKHHYNILVIKRSSNTLFGSTPV